RIARASRLRSGLGSDFHECGRVACCPPAAAPGAGQQRYPVRLELRSNTPLRSRSATQRDALGQTQEGRRSRPLSAIPQTPEILGVVANRSTRVCHSPRPGRAHFQPAEFFRRRSGSASALGPNAAPRATLGRRQTNHLPRPTRNSKGRRLTLHAKACCAWGSDGRHGGAARVCCISCSPRRAAARPYPMKTPATGRKEMKKQLDREGAIQGLLRRVKGLAVRRTRDVERCFWIEGIRN